MASVSLREPHTMIRSGSRCCGRSGLGGCSAWRRPWGDLAPHDTRGRGCHTASTVDTGVCLREGGLGVDRSGGRSGYGRVLCYAVLGLLLKPDYGFTRGRATKAGQIQYYACSEFPNCQTRPIKASEAPRGFFNSHHGAMIMTCQWICRLRGSRDD